jgi:uncharacterized protein YcbX
MRMAEISLVHHYLEYLRSPAVLLTILVITGPFILEAVKNRLLPSKPAKYRIPGCFRLGLSKKGNLQDQTRSGIGETVKDDDQSGKTTKPKIKALFTYPVKSCRGVELAASEVVTTGLKYDRLFTFAQRVGGDASSGEKVQWRFITQREFPRLALLETELWAPDPRAKKQTNANGKTVKPAHSEAEEEARAAEDWAANGGCVILRFQYEPSQLNPLGIRNENITFNLPLKPTAARAKAKAYSIESLSIWKDYASGINMSTEVPADDFARLKSFLGVKNEFAIFRVDDRSRRAVTRSLPHDTPNDKFSVGFADAFPLHILSLASIQQVFSEQRDQEQRKFLDARRFRANIYLTDTAAFDEDRWKRIKVGRCLKLPSNPNKNKKPMEIEGEYHVACRTARCKLPNVHPETGVKDRNEPYSTLARTRQVDEGAKPYPVLGMQMIPLFQQGILRVGDEVDVMETGEHVYEKMFA